LKRGKEEEEVGREGREVVVREWGSKRGGDGYGGRRNVV